MVRRYGAANTDQHFELRATAPECNRGQGHIASPCPLHSLLLTRNYLTALPDQP